MNQTEAMFIIEARRHVAHAWRPIHDGRGAEDAAKDWLDKIHAKHEELTHWRAYVEAPTGGWMLYFDRMPDGSLRELVSRRERFDVAPEVARGWRDDA